MIRNDSYDLAGNLRSASEELKREVVAGSLPGRTGEAISDWTVEPVTANTIGNGTLGFAKVSASVSVDNRETSWSSFVKALGPPTWEQGTEFNNPGREIKAYRSGFFKELQHGLRAADCYAVTENEGDITWLWLEDLSGLKPAPWTAEDFLAAMYHVGQFNGEWPESRPHSYVWIPTDGSTNQPKALLKFWESRYADMVGGMQEPPVRPYAERVGIDRIAGLWPKAQSVVGAIESLPRSIAHNDMYVRNMFATQDRRITYAFDWASLGYSATGADGGGTAGASLTWSHEEAMLVGGIEPQMFEAYVEGLRSVGWDGSRDDVRLGYLATVTMYVAGLVPCLYHVGLDGPQADRWLNRFAATKDEALEQAVERLHSFLPLIDEAAELADSQ